MVSGWCTDQYVELGQKAARNGTTWFNVAAVHCCIVWMRLAVKWKRREAGPSVIFSRSPPTKATIIYTLVCSTKINGPVSETRLALNKGHVIKQNKMHVLVNSGWCNFRDKLLPFLKIILQIVKSISLALFSADILLLILLFAECFSSVAVSLWNIGATYHIVNNVNQCCCCPLAG